MTTILVYKSYMISLQSIMSSQPLIYISQYWHMPMNKYAYNTTHVCPTALIMYSTYRNCITAHTIHKKLQLYLQCYCQICTSNIYAPQMTQMPIISYADLRQLCQHIYLSWTPHTEHSDQEHWYTHMPHYWHIALIRYVCHFYGR